LLKANTLRLLFLPFTLSTEVMCLPAVSGTLCIWAADLRGQSFLGVKVHSLTIESLNDPDIREASSEIQTAVRLSRERNFLHPHHIYIIG